MKTLFKKFLAVTALALMAAGCYPSGAKTAHTAIPTLVQATLPVSAVQDGQTIKQGACRVAALDLIGAWVQAGKPESDPFSFQAADGQTCEGAFAVDIQPLFNEPNVWFQGAMACSSCHSPDLASSAARMDLSTYQGLLAGAQRSDQAASGQDILAGDWEKSILYGKIFTRQMPPGRPSDALAKGPDVLAGSKK